MTLSIEVLSEIDLFTRGGFEDRDRIVEILTKEMYEPGDLDVEEVERAVAEAIEELDKQKATWPTVTDCDKLTTAFAGLSAKGIIALQYAGYTQSDGYEEISSAFRAHTNRESVLGYCFYHAQDLMRAVGGGGLYLAFGPMDAKKEETDGPRIGALIADSLQHAGLAVRWDGTFDQRIFIPEIDWKRR